MKRPAGWTEAVEKATGYGYSGAIAIVRKRGGTTRECTLDDIVAHVRADLRERAERRRNRPPRYTRTGQRQGRVLRTDDKRLAPKRAITHGGETHSFTEWARRLGIHPHTLHERIDRLGEHEAMTRSLAQPGRWPRGAMRAA